MATEVLDKVIEQVVREERSKEFKINVPMSCWFEKANSQGTKHLYIAGFACTGGLDRQGDDISDEALKACAADLMRQGSRTVFFNHLHRELPAGQVIDSGYKEVANGQEIIKGIWVIVEVSNAKSLDDIRTQIKEGVLSSFSIGGRFLKVEEIMEERMNDKGEKYQHWVGYKVLEMELFEVSIVGLPAQPRAGIYDTITKAMTKDIDCEVKYIYINKEEDKKIVGKVVEKSEGKANSNRKEDSPQSSKSKDEPKPNDSEAYETYWSKMEGQMANEPEKKAEEAVKPAETAPVAVTEKRVEEMISPVTKVVGDVAEMLGSIKQLLEKKTEKIEEKIEDKKEVVVEPEKKDNEEIKALQAKVAALEEQVKKANEAEAKGVIVPPEKKEEVVENPQEAKLKELGLDKDKDFGECPVAVFYMENKDLFDKLSDDNKRLVKSAYAKLLLHITADKAQGMSE